MKLYKFPKSYDTLNSEQKLIFNILKYGYDSHIHYFITGDAGVGKSYLIDVFTDFCKINNINIVKTAPTGVAATNIKGTTYHKQFKLPLSVLTEQIEPSQFANMYKVLQYMDILFIDEIGMARVDAFDNIMRQVQEINKIRAKFNKQPVQVILSGDFGQLQPVITDQDKINYQKLYQKDIGNGCCYNSHWWTDMDFKPLILTTPMRQSDAAFCTALNNIKIGIKQDIDYLNQNSAQSEIKNGIWLCGYNNTAAHKNALGIFNLPGKEYHSDATIIGKANIKHTNMAEKLIYKKNARVMMTMRDLNQPRSPYCNGSLGTIENISPNGAITIRLDTGVKTIVNKIKLPFIEYNVVNGRMEAKEVGYVIQYPFKIGYAITIHKSQGQTYDAMNLVPEIFTPGQLYTALSRCKTLQNIYIQPDQYNNKITEKKIMPNIDIVKFMIKLESDYNTYKDWYMDTIGYSE